MGITGRSLLVVLSSLFLPHPVAARAGTRAWPIVPQRDAGSFSTEGSWLNRPVALSIGMSLVEIRASDWEGALTDAGYGDAHFSPGGFFTSDETTQYPKGESEGNPELFYVDLTVGVLDGHAVALSYATNEPFSGVVGFEADAGSISTDGKFLYLTPTIQSFSLRWTATGLLGGHGWVGAGPSVHLPELRGYHRVDDGEPPSRSFTVDATRLGLSLRGGLQGSLGFVRFGVDAEYSYVGSVEVGPQETGDPAFPTTDFGFGYAFVGVSVGIRR